MKIFILVPFLYVSPLYAHGGIDHSKAVTAPAAKQAPTQSAYEEISQQYVASIEAIFKAKCFDCHSTQTNYPWYHKIPGIGHLMDSHISGGRSHLDMTAGFPFKSHVPPLEDLRAIQRAVEESSMPPWYYAIFHKNSRLNESEKKEILKWSIDAQKKIGSQ